MSFPEYIKGEKRAPNYCGFTAVGVLELRGLAWVTGLRFVRL
jgi:hypothetical protein